MQDCKPNTIPLCSFGAVASPLVRLCGAHIVGIKFTCSCSEGVPTTLSYQVLRFFLPQGSRVKYENIAIMFFGLRAISMFFGLRDNLESNRLEIWNVSRFQLKFRLTSFVLDTVKSTRNVEMSQDVQRPTTQFCNDFLYIN